MTMKFSQYNVGIYNLGIKKKRPISRVVTRSIDSGERDMWVCEHTVTKDAAAGS